MVGSRGYVASEVESKWQEAWARTEAFAPDPAGEGDTFVYACTPFTTGKAHMGHVRSYTLADVCARRARSEGRSVLWAMGFDAFGLPNEVAAVDQAVPPAQWVESCRLRMTDQFRRLGLSTDPTRVFVTSHPDYYRWTQWAFLKLLDRGLVYRAEGVENWCETCGCILASLQVADDGRCWRCGGKAGLACVPQWYMRITPYAEELWRGLDDLDGWDETAVAFQRTLLGRREGYEAEVKLDSGGSLTVFAASMEALATAAAVIISPNHPDLEQMGPRSEVTRQIEAQRRRSLKRAERSAHVLPVVDLGLFATVEGRSEPLPVLASPSVDLRFGGGAAFCAPACDPEDAALAQQLNLESVAPVSPVTPVRTAVRYRLRDASISRQRSWGTPIPVVHCPGCGLVPVRETDLPVRLPEDLAPTGRGSALGEHPAFAACDCPRCGQAARRETDTLDVHIDSLWMLVPFCVPAEDRDRSMFTHADLARWLPVSQVVCGADQAGWWLNDRFFFKVLRDIGLLKHMPHAEPVRRLLMHEMVLADGRKMSKSLGNVVDPDEVISRWGADAARLAVLKVNPRKAFSWTDDSLQENHAFLSALWDFVDQIATDGGGGAEPGQRRLERWSQAAQRKVAAAYERRAFHLVLRELKTLFQLIRRHRGDGGAAAPEAYRVAVRSLLDLLEPLAPHVSAELKGRLDCVGAPRTGSPSQVVRTSRMEPA